MGNTIQEVLAAGERGRKLVEAMPEVYEKLGEVHKAAMRSEKLDNKTKELIAVAIAISVRCTTCMLFHVKAALNEGCTRDEMIGCIEIASMMGGGPGSAYGAMALEMYDDYAASK